MDHTFVLLVTCPDRPGIVATVSGLLYRHGANIIDADQHSDLESGTFFLRIEWEHAGFVLDRDGFRAAFAPLAQEFGMDWQVFSTDEPQRMAIMVSKYDHCLWDLLIRHRSGELRAEIPLILSNHPDLEPVAAHFGIPFRHIPASREIRDEAETRQLEALAAVRPDVIVLARYMQILSPRFVAAYPQRIINIHHSFLPAFIGASPYRQAHARGVKVIGATAHYVTEELDQGPIIEQVVTRVSHRDRVRDLERRGRDMEQLALAHAVRMHLEHRVLCYGNKTVVFE